MERGVGTNKTHGHEERLTGWIVGVVAKRFSCPPCIQFVGGEVSVFGITEIE
jgi:hypothetical protein